MSEKITILRSEVKVGTMVELTRDGVTVIGPHSECQDDVHIDIPGQGGRACTDDGWEFVQAWRVMSEDEIALACAWSDYRKGYGASGPEAHSRFKVGWAAQKQGLPRDVLDAAELGVHSFAGYDAALDPARFDEATR